MLFWLYEFKLIRLITRESDCAVAYRYLAVLIEVGIFIYHIHCEAKLSSPTAKAKARRHVRTTNDTYSRSAGLQALCSISSRRQVAVVMGNEEPEIRAAAASRTPHSRLLAGSSTFALSLLGRYAPDLL
jgi:hypothetical protein